MLGNLNAGMKRGWRITRKDGHLFLGDDFTGVHTSIDEVDGTTGNGSSGIERLFPCLQTGKTREERGMNIDKTAREGIKHGGLDHAHVAGEDNEINPCFAKKPDNIFLHLRRETGAELRLVNGNRGNTGIASELKDAGISHIGKHKGNLGINGTALDRLQNGPKIRPFS